MACKDQSESCNATENVHEEKQLNIKSTFTSEGKRHILPVSLLLQLKTLVQQKTDSISEQIIAHDEITASPAVPHDKDEDSWSEFRSLDLFQGTPTRQEEEQFAKPKNKKQKVFQSQDVRNMPEFKKKSRKRSSDSTDEEKSSSKKKRPNYFVAVQVTNPEILDIAKKIQKGIQEKSAANLAKATIGVEKFHITLMVMHLPDALEVKKAVESLDSCVAAIAERTSGQPVSLSFEGLSTFNGGRVLFATLKATEGLDHLNFMAGEVSKQMNQTGIFSTDGPSKKFNPHLTLMKFQGDKELLKQGVKKVEASQYSQYVDEVFGTQAICSIQLCKMNEKREDGYYFVEHEVYFCK